MPFAWRSRRKFPAKTSRKSVREADRVAQHVHLDILRARRFTQLALRPLTVRGAGPMIGRFAILVALFPAVSGNVSASADTINNRFDKTGVAGVPMFIGHFAHVDPDCSSSGRTFVRVSRGPTHGVVTTQERIGFSSFLHWPACNSHKVKGVTVWYRPEKGFTGYDAMELDIIFPSGNEHVNYYNVTIK